MTQISSEPTYNTTTLNDGVTLALRTTTEKRVATIGHLLDESRQRHIVDGFAYETIYHYGRDIERKLCAQMRDRQDLQELTGPLTRGLESQIYEMEPASASRAESVILPHYRPYVNRWWQQGRGISEIETLCNICMEGDHALTGAFPRLRLEVQTALARGDAVCRLYSYQSGLHETEWQS